MTSAAEQPPRTRWWQTALAGLVTFVLVVATGLVAALVVVPKVMGGMSLTVLTGSMEPYIVPGDVVVTRGVDEASAANLRVGDVIAFLPYPDDPTLVTHRIVAKSINKSGTWFITQGDNNNAPDPWGPVGDFQVRGQVEYVVPKVGWLRQWTGHVTPWLLPAVGMSLIIAGFVGFITAGRRRRGGEESQTSSCASHDATSGAESQDLTEFVSARRGQSNIG